MQIRLNPNSTELDDHILSMQDHIRQIKLLRQQNRNVSSALEQGRRQMAEQALSDDDAQHQLDDFETDSISGPVGSVADLDFGLADLTLRAPLADNCVFTRN